MRNMDRYPDTSTEELRHNYETLLSLVKDLRLAGIADGNAESRLDNYRRELVARGNLTARRMES